MKAINHETIILSSRSPRRKELLEQMGITLRVHPSDIDEAAVSITTPDAYVKELSFLKAEKTACLYPDSWVLGADTIVVTGDLILGKPESKEKAVEMLQALNNSEHSVYTAFCLMCRAKNIVKTRWVQTLVSFKALSPEEINWYAETKEPYDKAGGYGIQGMGAFLVKRISGSYSNVVGLPVCEVIETLKSLRIIQF